MEAIWMQIARELEPAKYYVATLYYNIWPWPPESHTSLYWM